jgi:hypothetical protein
MSLRFFLTLALFLVASPLFAEDRILFVGNSFTYADGGTASVPDIFDRLAVAGGQSDPTTVMRAVGGQNFQFHETDATSQAAIASQPWTYVILQNYSTEPTHVGSVANHMTYGNLLYQRVLANNPATRVILYQTWSRAAANPLISGASTPTTFASTDEMQSELRTNYRSLADTLKSANPANPPVIVAPVGDAWQNAGGFLAESDPSFADVHGPDNYHGNDNGYYLSAAVFYATIYGQSPEGLHTSPAVSSLNLHLTIDPAFLERIAWKTVTGTLEVRYVAQPAARTANQNEPVTFTAKALGSLPFTVQWFKDGQPISGATDLSYTIPAASSDLNGSSYSVTVSNSVSSLPSDPATLTVRGDITPPTPAQPALTDPVTVTVAFSEALAPGPATTPGNFSVVYRGRHIPVTSATLSSDGSAVTLTLGSPIQPGFVIGVGQAVKDASGNPVAAGTISVSPDAVPAEKKFLFDFGADETPTNPVDDSSNNWNNVDLTVGASNTGVLNGLVDSTGTSSTAHLEMVRRFNGANTNGTLTAANYPAPASRDSLYGNTESFNGLAGIFPAFRLVGLDPLTRYLLTFYASRLGAADDRETLYTVTGATVNTATLNAANNVDNSVTLTGLSPDSSGALLIELSPSAQNDNANHFTYLGALILTATPGAVPSFYPPAVVEGRIVLDWTGAGQLEFSPDLKSPWTPVSPAPSPPCTQPLVNPARFFRLSAATTP